MQKSKKREMVTDKELEIAFEYTNYGPEPDHRYIVKWGLMKATCGYATGHTTKTVLQALGLLSKSVSKPVLTIRGRYCLWEFFRDGYRH